jgi:SET domain-containing protein
VATRSSSRSSSAPAHPAVARHAARTVSTTHPFEVRRSRIQGRGVFATRAIRPGKRLIQYVGQAISHEEADRRYDDRNGRHHTFLFVLDDETVLDAKRGGNDARFINHSCEPNCQTVIEDGEIWVEAIKPIAADQELVYDYRFEWDDAYEPEDVRYYACRCGSTKCRGTILRVPVYLRPTIREWLAGNDVKRPRKPVKGVAKKAAKKAAAKQVVKKSVKKVAKKSAATGSARSRR